MITVENLTKKYGGKAAVDDLSFEIKPGKVTGFLGPNGSGKSTTMRLIVGLDRPNSGTVRLNNKSIRDFKQPMHEIGVLLDADYMHPTRSAMNHLLSVAASNGYGKKRVREVLELVGLNDVVKKRVGKFSLGMKQRVGLAGALLGDPGIIMLDEPGNGLDPEGIRWIRDFLSHLAKEGRTVFVSSHLLSEMSLMADDLVVIGQGKMIAHTTVQDITSQATGGFVRVKSPQFDEMKEALQSSNIEHSISGQEIHVTDGNLEQIGHLAYKHNIELHELAEHAASLEDAFLQLTASAQEYKTGQFVSPENLPNHEGGK